jgi:hypothetical protein
MALKNLTAGEMLSVSEALVKRGTPQYDLLARTAETAPLLPRLELARGAILAAQPLVPPENLLAEVQKEEAAVDKRHDELARGVFDTLGGFAVLETDSARRKALFDLRDTLFPQGLSVVQRSYREEAGQGTMLEARLKPEHRTQLRELPTPRGSLLDAVTEWLATAKQLGELEDRRILLSPQTGPMPAAMVAARNQWIRAMHALMSLAEFALSPEETELLFGRARAASALADRRAAVEAPPAAPSA